MQDGPFFRSVERAGAVAAAVVGVRMNRPVAGPLGFVLTALAFLFFRLGLRGQ